MINKKRYKLISRQTTTELLLMKAVFTKKIALYNAIKLGMIGLLGLFVTHLFNALLSGAIISRADVLACFAIVICASGGLTFHLLEASVLAQKEFVVDMLAIRSNRSKKS